MGHEVSLFAVPRTTGSRSRWLPVLLVLAAAFAPGGTACSAQQEIRLPLSPALGGEFLQQAVPARQTRCCVRPQDEYWVISTRELADRCVCGDYRVARYGQSGYQPDSLESLAAAIAADSHRPTMIYVHGNFTDMGWSLQRGCEVYNHVIGDHPCDPGIRFIVWSWKTERESGPVCDFDIKLARSVEEGERLAGVIDALGIPRPVVIGYSLGCQAILSALTQPGRPVATPWTVGLIAPALECGFAPRLKEAPLTENSVAGMVLFTNRRDRALRYSRLRCQALDCRSVPLDQYSVQPLLRCGGLCPRVIEISNEAGSRHAISRYYSSPTVVCTVRRLVLGDGAVEHAPQKSCKAAEAVASQPGWESDLR